MNSHEETNTPTTIIEKLSNSIEITKLEIRREIKLITTNEREKLGNIRSRFRSVIISSGE